jgi:predicted RND superfamily exporter protein
VPDNRDLSAQYLLLYEISLPYGLDLNDRINVDKSATRVTATLGDVSSIETKQFLNSAIAWLADNAPAYMQAKPTSAQVMFTYIAARNVQNMVGGTIAAVLIISVILMLALRSFGLGMLSLVPNGLPILATFGAWAILVGEIGFSVATVASISLGIVVDDTVHFLAKYARARREQGLDAGLELQGQRRHGPADLAGDRLRPGAGFPAAAGPAAVAQRAGERHPNRNRRHARRGPAGRRTSLN